jgi:hypothetical protein
MMRTQGAAYEFRRAGPLLRSLRARWRFVGIRAAAVGRRGGSADSHRGGRPSDQPRWVSTGPRRALFASNRKLHSVMRETIAKAWPEGIGAKPRASPSRNAPIPFGDNY